MKLSSGLTSVGLKRYGLSHNQNKIKEIEVLRTLLRKMDHFHAEG